MKVKNRLFRNQADYIFEIVRKPVGWEPRRLNDVPPKYEVLSAESVASFEEAQEDLVRCNELALQQKLNKWAVIQSPDGGL